MICSGQWPAGLQVVHRDQSTGAPTLLFTVHVDRGTPWHMAQHLLSQAVQRPSLPGDPNASLPGPGMSCGKALAYLA